MDTRDCKKYDLSKIETYIPELKDTNFELYIDIGNSEEIISIIENNSSKTRRILYEISQHRYKNNLYEKLVGYNDLTAFVYKGSENLRIYCKEFKNGKKKIVAAFGIHKKSYKIKKGTKSKLDGLSKTKYNFYE